MGDANAVFHEVCVDDFYIGKYEVTQAQWSAIRGNNPSYSSNCGDNCPVEQVSWNDIQEFIRELSQQTGKTYRLPTEAEWEYAAQSGGKSEKYAGTSSEAELGDYAWYDKNSGSKTHPVGQKKPNGLGIYDMTGNVWEWCSDWYDESYYKNSPKDNPQGPSNGSARVLRGGSWYGYAWTTQASYRNSVLPYGRYGYLGFRLARTR
jgi:formylglycine-generating enzyme required for sulfatase activity